MARILLGVSGGIAAYKALELVRLATGAGHPVRVAPAMNNHMYEHPATRANLQTLRERGVTIVAPGEGRLASKGEQGIGRLAEPAQLLDACEAALAAGRSAGGQANGAVTARGGDWDGVKVLVTAGGTREPIDSVRFLGNSSSGRMGLALAEAAEQRGAQVTLVAANVALAAPAGVQRLDVLSAAELRRACEREFPGCDVLLMAAAVADFTPAAPLAGKIKKSERALLEVALEPTADVLTGLAARRREGQTLVGFDVDANEVTILSARNRVGVAGERSEIQRRHVPRATKAQVAEAILDAVESLRASR